MNGDGYQNGAAYSGRPLTVDEALPYSPLSSIVPFGPGTGLAPRRARSNFDLVVEHHG